MKSSRIVFTQTLVVYINIEQVCRNSSPHLRGNVYVHYVSRESAVAAYNHMNGRFYAKKQVWGVYLHGQVFGRIRQSDRETTVCVILRNYQSSAGTSLSLALLICYIYWSYLFKISAFFLSRFLFVVEHLSKE